MISDKRIENLAQFAYDAREEGSVQFSIIENAIRTACAEAVAIEREECAKICFWIPDVGHPGSAAAAIRARGKGK